MGIELYILDLIGTLTFAFYGAYVGIEKRFDIFGIITTAFLTALAGGTIREIILGHLPLYFSDMYYVLAVFLGVIISIIAYPIFSRIHKYALIVDAIGLVTFAFIGAESASRAGLGAFGIIFLATLTAVGGGLIRDIAIAQTPQILYRDFYASPAIVLGILYVLFQNIILQNPMYVYLILIIALTVRLFAIYFKLDLWGPWRNK